MTDELKAVAMAVAALEAEALEKEKAETRANEAAKHSK